MNSNRNNNNRRRGRGNNRGQGGGNFSNRVDNRARGNAPQMLDKYKKLAHDASLNDDRVQTEYYLQFADHYFRVIADNKAQKDEQRGKRDDRDQDSDDSNDGDDEDNTRRSRGRSRRNDNRQDDDDFQQGSEGEEASDDENPFTREAKPKPKRARQPRKKADDESGEKQEAGNGIDAGVLPPSIRSDDGDGEVEKPRRRTRRPRTTDGDDEPISAVG